MSEDMEFLPKKDVLSLEELDRLCNTFIDLGVKKLRITGGEPLLSKDTWKILVLIKNILCFYRCYTVKTLVIMFMPRTYVTLISKVTPNLMK